MNEHSTTLQHEIKVSLETHRIEHVEYELQLQLLEMQQILIAIRTPEFDMCIPIDIKEYECTLDKTST